MTDKDRVDELVIELTARNKATDKIDNLARSLKGLGDTLTNEMSGTKLNNVANAMQGISKATQELGRSTRAINNLPKLTSELSNMMTTLSQAPAISKDVLSLAHALSKIDGSAIKGFSKASTKVNTNTATEEMKAVESETKNLDSQTKEVTNSFANFGKVASEAFNSILPSAKSFSKLAFDKLTSALKSMGSQLGKLTSHFWKLYRNASLFHKINNIGLKKGFTTLLRYTVGIRSLFVLTNKIRRAIEDGNKNLAQYSTEFNKSMSLYKSGLGTLKNAMSVAFAPLVNYFSEAINKVIDSFISAFNTIARLMARLTGAKQVVQATRYYEDFAESLDKSNKSAKQLTTGIDELNILNESTGKSGSGASTNVQDMFETVDVTSEFDSWIDKLKDMWDKSDFSDLGKSFADKINSGLQNIDWATIKTNAGKLGKSLATFLNGALEEELNGQSLGYTLGKTLGEAINTGLEFQYQFVTNFHWASLGQAIADGIKGALETIDFKKLGATFHRFVNGVLEALTTLFSDEKMWEDLGKAIGNFFSELNWKETWFNFTKMLKALVKGLKKALKEWQKTDPDSFNVAITLLVTLSAIKIIGFLSGIGITSAIAKAFQGKGILATVAGVGALHIPLSALLIIKKPKLEIDNKTLFSDFAKQGSGKISEGSTGALDTLQNKVKDLTNATKEYNKALDESSAKNKLWNSALEENNVSLGNQDTWVQTASTSISDTYGGALTNAETNTALLRDNLANTWAEVRNNIFDKNQLIKDTLVNKWNEIGTSITGSLSTIKKTNKDTFEDIKTTDISTMNQNAKGLIKPTNAIISQAESTSNSVTEGLNQQADAIKEFTTFSWINPFTKESFNSIGVAIKKIAKLTLPKVSMFENGGYIPNTNMGSLFWAGENGAEVVAHANGGTEVLNASQVAVAVSGGVKQAIVEAITPYMVQLVNSNQAIADKDMSVNIGDREIAKANRRGESQLGMQFVTVS